MRPRCIPSTATTTTGSRAGCGAASAARRTPPTWPRTPSSRSWFRARPRASTNRAPSSPPSPAACNHYRRQDVERAYLEALASLPEREVPSEETRAIVLETLVELDRLLDGLPPLAKETFLLAQLDGLGYAEIATQLGISLSSVKRYMLKAAQRCYFAELP